MIATTKEQGKHLMELGLPAETADMSYSQEYGNNGWYWQLNACKPIDVEGVLPAWSLDALFEVMPNNDYWEICLWQYADAKWQCVFDDVEFSSGETKAFVAKDPLTAAYEMVCWLLENGYIKKGENNETRS